MSHSFLLFHQKIKPVFYAEGLPTRLLQTVHGLLSVGGLCFEKGKGCPDPAYEQLAVTSACEPRPPPSGTGICGTECWVGTAASHQQALSVKAQVVDILGFEGIQSLLQLLNSAV